MAKDGVWGDQLELNAMANIFKFNAMIHQVDNPSLMQKFIEPIKDVPTIHISFHLNCHYNSVRRGDDPCTDEIVPVLQYTIGNDLDAIKKKLKGKDLNLDPIFIDESDEDDDEESDDLENDTKKKTQKIKENRLKT